MWNPLKALLFHLMILYILTVSIPAPLAPGGYFPLRSSSVLNVKTFVQFGLLGDSIILPTH